MTKEDMKQLTIELARASLEMEISILRVNLICARLEMYDTYGDQLRSSLDLAVEIKNWAIMEEYRLISK
jgi:hypothetical protein